MSDIQAKLERWLNEPTMDRDLKKELVDLHNIIDDSSATQADIDDLNDRFYKDMTFGTGGLRGKIGAGTNRMNIYTIRQVSQAFSLYLLKNNSNPSIVIAYDNRRYSDLFAFEAACVYAANGVKVNIFKELTPTPMLSFAVRQLKTSGGVVITASHNNKEYNGYKIYDENGCQCLPDKTEQVSASMKKINMFTDVKTYVLDHTGTVTEKMNKAVSENQLINFVSDDVNDSYYQKVLNEEAFQGDIKNISAVYTPLNGTGSVPVQKVLSESGIGKLHVVKEQAMPDPDFTTCPNPNPEEDEALKKGLELCRQLENEGNPPDILMATDPDCDRVGVIVRDGDDFKRLDGNQVGILLFDFIINCRKGNNTLPEKPVMITTIVSTPMAEEIAYRKRIHIDKTLTGFKYIGHKIYEYEVKKEDDRFIFGFEESCGYLAGTYVRDKDAVSTCLLIGEMTGYYKAGKINLMERMNELYEEYGYFMSAQESITENGEEGAQRIAKIMDKFRSGDIFDMFNTKIVQVKDYENQTKRTMGLFDGDDGGCPMAIGIRPIRGLPKENVMEFDFKNRSKLTIRPSGTEPKIKIYFSSLGKTEKDAERTLELLRKEFMKLVAKM